MDLFSILRAVWRHKLATIPVIVLTALGAFYVLAIKPPVYVASSSFLLVYPPLPPSSSQVAADPGLAKLAKINPNNPYTGLGGLSPIADVVIETVAADSSSQQALAHAGAGEYQATLSTDFGSPPIVQISGMGPSAQAAIRTANLVTSAATFDLYKMQRAQGVNDVYMVKAIKVATPDHAKLQTSGKLRTLIAVLALGAILLFVVVSVTEAMEKRRGREARPGDAELKRFHWDGAPQDALSEPPRRFR